MNLPQLIGEYIAQLPDSSASGLSNPARTRQAALRAYIRWQEEEGNGFNEDSLKRYRDWLERKEDDKRVYSPHTVQLYLSALRSFLEWAVVVGYIDEALFVQAQRLLSVFKSERPISYKRPPIRNKYLRQIVDHLSGKPEPIRKEPEKVTHWEKVRHKSAWRDRALINVLVDTGLRVSELLSLPREPFDHHLQIVGVTEPMMVRVEHGKGDIAKTVVVSPDTLEMVHDYLMRRHDDLLPLFISYSNRRSESGALSSRSVQRLIERTANALQIDRSNTDIVGKITPHAYRHALARALQDAGCSLDEIADLLGHTNLNTTRLMYAGDKSDISKIKTARIGWSKLKDE